MKASDFFDNAAINLLVHGTLLFAFLSAFFYFYIAKLIDEHLSHEIVREFRDVFDSTYEKMDPMDRLRASVLLQQMPLGGMATLYSKTDDVKVENNYFNKMCTMLILGALISIIAVLLITYTFRCGRTIDLGHIMKENAIIFFFVMLAELGFFFKIASKYIPVMPSSIMRDIVQRIKNNFSQ